MTELIETAGLPHCGRTTLMVGLHRTLSSFGVRVRTFPEEALRLVLPQWQTEPFDFLVSSASQTVKDAIEAKESGLYEVALIERGIFDHLVSTRALLAAKRINEEMAKGITGFLEPQIEKEDLIVFLDVSPETSLKRDQKGDQTMPFGLTANPEFLRHLQKAYQEIMSRIPLSKLLKIDGKKDIPTVREITLKAICQRLGRDDLLNPKVRNVVSAPNHGPKKKGGEKNGVIKALLRGAVSKGQTGFQPKRGRA